MKSKNKNVPIKWFLIAALISVFVAVACAVGAGYYVFGDVLRERDVIEIPNFVGEKFANIEKHEKIDIEIEPIFSNDVPSGRVISQSPCGGAKRKIAEGEKYTVKLTVSLGKETKRIPDLRNCKYTDAAAVLRSLGAKIKIVSVYDDGLERDLVLRTAPEVGKSLEYGDTVTLFVSRNHVRGAIKVKDFKGMLLEDASAEILAEGLILGNVVYEYSDLFPEGEVISQSIMKESLVPYGSSINIVVSRGRKKEELHPFRGEYTEDNGEINESIY